MWNIDRETFRAIFLAPCYYCGAPHALGIDRLDNSAGYVVSNAVPCCSACNYAKRDMTEAAFLNLVRRIHSNRIVA